MQVASRARLHFHGLESYVISVRAFKRSRWTTLNYFGGGPITLSEQTARWALDQAKRVCYDARMRRFS